MNNADAIFIPDDERILYALDALPADLRPYRDHAALLLYFASLPKWQRRIGWCEFTPLNNSILRDYIPANVIVPLREYLKAKKIIDCDSYSAGKRSIGHRVNPAFLTMPRLWPLTNTRLIEKRRTWKATPDAQDAPELRDVKARREPIIAGMRGALDCLTLAAPARDVERALRGQGIDPAHLRFITATIEHGNHEGLTIDGFGWRVHSIITCAAKSIREFFRFDNRPLVELDVTNAQPLIFAAALQSPELFATYIANVQHNGVVIPGGGLPGLSLLRGVSAIEVKGFARACEIGLFYEILSAESKRTREQTKKEVFRDVFFGRLQQRGPVSDAFRKLWPGIYAAIQGLKADYGYKIVSRILQRMESTIIIDGVCGRIVQDLPGVQFATVHDAALVVVDKAQAVAGMIEAEFDRYGVRATVKRKIFAEKSTSPLKAPGPHGNNIHHEGQTQEREHDGTVKASPGGPQRIAAGNRT